MRYNFDWIKIATLISILATLVIVAFTYYQLNSSNEFTKADFAHRFKSDFFTDNTRELITLFDNDLLKFTVLTGQKKEFPCFIVDTLGINRLSVNGVKILNPTKSVFSDYEIDDFLLNHFDDLGLYEKRGIIDLEYIYNGFDWYIETVYQNPQIQKYLQWLKKDSSTVNSFENLESLVKKLKGYKEGHL
jgi:hypothetical protein